MTKEEHVKRFITKIEDSIEELRTSIGEDNMNFVGSIAVFYEDSSKNDMRAWWSVGNIEECELNAEDLLNDIKIEKETNNLFDVSLN